LETAVRSEQRRWKWAAPARAALAVRAARSVQARSLSRIPHRRAVRRIAFGILREIDPGFRDVKKHGALSRRASRLGDLNAFLGALSIIRGHDHVAFSPTTNRISIDHKAFNSNREIYPGNTLLLL
jgi:hypothetical protein